MTHRETEEEAKRREQEGMKKWLASEEYKVFRKESLEANAKLCQTGLSNAEYPPAPEVQKLFAKRLRASLWGVVDQYNGDEFPNALTYGKNVYFCSWLY